MKMRCFPRLVVLKAEGATGSIYPFPSGRCSLGGLPTCDIHIPSAGKSHCLVVVDKNNQAHIINVDGPSVQLNGVPVGNEEFVNHKDLIQIGAKSFRFEWFSKRERGTSDSAEVPADDEGAMRESSALENGAGDKLRADQGSHGTPESHGTQGPHVTPAASSSSASFLDQSVYKTPHIPPEEFVSPLTASGSNDSGRQSQGANISKGSLKRGAVKGAGRSTNPSKRLSWSGTPQRSDQEPAEVHSRSRGPNSSLFVTPSQGVHVGDQDDEKAGGQVSDYVPSTTSTPLVDEPRMRAVRSQSSLANGEGLSGGRVSDCVPSTTSTPLIDEPKMRAVRSQSSLANGECSRSEEQGQGVHSTVSLSDSTLSMSSAISISSDSAAPNSAAPNSSSHSWEDLGDPCYEEYVLPDPATPSTSKGIFAYTPIVPPPCASSSSHSGAKKQRALHNSPMKKSVRGRSSVSRSSDSSSGEEESFEKLQDFARPSTSKGISAASTPVVPPPRGAGQLSNGAKTRGRSSSRQSNPNTTISEAPDSSQSFFDTSAGSSEVLSFADGHSSSATSLRTPRTNVPRKSSNVSGGSVGYRSLRKTPKRSLGSGNVNKLDPNEATPPDAPGSPADGRATSQNHAQNGQAIEAKVPGSLERSIDISSVSTPRVQRKGKETRLYMKSSPGCDEQAQKGSRASRTPSVKGREVETPARKGRKEDDSFEYKNTSPKPSRSSHAGSSKKSPGGSEELGSPSTSSRVSRAHALTVTNGQKEATHQEVAQKSFRSTRSGSLAGSSTAVEKGNSSQQEVDSPAKTPTTGRVPTPEDFSRSPVVALEKLVIPARTTKVSCMPLSANKDVAAKGDRKSLTGAAAANKSGTSNGFDEACGVSRTATPTELLHDADGSVTSKKNTKASSTPASTSVNEADAPKLEAVQKSFRGRSGGKRASKAHGDAEASQQEVTDVPIRTPKTNYKENPSDSPVIIARSSRGSRRSASHGDKPEAEEKDTVVKRSRCSSTGARASSRSEEDEAREQDTAGIEKPSDSSAVARSSRGGRTPTSTNDGTQGKGTVAKSTRESSAGRRAASKRALEDSDNSDQNSASLPATTAKANHQQSFEGPSDSPVVARSSRDSRTSASREDKPEAEEKDTVVKRSRGSSTGARVSSRPEEDEAQEQDTAGIEKPSDSSAIARSSRGGRTPTSTNDGTQGKGTVAKKAREGSAGRRAASKRALEHSDNSEQGSASLPATTPKTECQQSFEGPSDSPVVARSSRGSRTSASREDKPEAEEKDTVVKRSRGSSTGARASSRPEEDEAREQDTAGVEKSSNSSANARSSRCGRTPTSTNDGTQGKGTVARKARESSAGRREASKCALEDNDNSEQGSASLPATTPKTERQQSFEGPSVTPVNARSTRGSQTPASQEQDTVVERSRASTAPKNRPEDEAQEDTSEETSVAGLGTPSTSTQETGRETVQHEIGPRGSRRSQAGHTRALNVAEEDETSEHVNVPKKTPKAGHQQIKKDGAASSKSRSQGDHLNITGFSTAESPRAVPKHRGSRSSNTPASKGTRAEDETSQHDIVDVAAETPQASKNKSEKDASVSTAQSSKTEHPARSSRANRISASANVSEDCDLQNTASTSQSLKAEQPTGSSRASRGSSSKKESEKHALQSDASSAQSPKTEQEPKMGSPVKARTSKGGHMPVSKKQSGENIAINQETGCMRQKSVATPTSNEVQGGKSQIPEPSPGATGISSTPVLKRASQASGTPRSEKKDPCSSSQASNQEQQQSDANTEQPADSVSKRRRPRHEKSADTEPGHGDNAERIETGTSAKKSRKAVATVSFENEQVQNELEALEAVQSSGQSRAKRATASRKQACADQHSDSFPSKEAATPDKGQQDEAAAAREVTAPRKIRGKRALASQLEASENQLNTEESTAGIPAKRGGRTAASTSDLNVDQEGSSMGTTKVTRTAAPESELKAEEKTASTLAKKTRAGRAAAAAATSGNQDDTVDDLPGGKIRAKRAAASESQLNTEESTAGVPERKKRAGRVAASTSGPKTDQNNTAEGSSLGKTTQASGSELNSAEDATDVRAKRKRGGRVAASTSGPKADQDHMAEGKTTQASGSELNSAEDTAGAPAKGKRGGRAAASSGPKTDQVGMVEGPSMGKKIQASGSELNSAEDTTDVPAIRKRGGRVAASTSGPKADQADVAEGKTTQASGSEINSAEDTADVPAKRKRGGRVAASTSGPKAGQADMAEGSSTGKTKVLREAAAGTSHSAEAKSSSRATRATSTRQKTAPKAETEPVPGEHQGGQASGGDDEAGTSSTLGRSKRRGAAAMPESLPPTLSTLKKTRGRRAKALDTIVDEEETGEPAVGSPVAVTEPRGSKRATRRKV